MLLKPTTMFAVCMACIISLVKSQLPNVDSFSSSPEPSFLESGSPYIFNSGFASISSTSDSSGATLNNVLRPPPDPNVEIFADSLFQLLQNSNFFKDLIPFTLDDPFETFFKDGIKILQTDNATDPKVAELVADAAQSVSSLTSDLYFNAASHMLGKILLYDSVLTQDTARSYPKIVLGYVEDYAKMKGISDDYSVIRSVSNGINNFIASIGLSTPDRAVLAFKIFVQELKALEDNQKN